MTSNKLNDRGVLLMRIVSISMWILSDIVILVSYVLGCSWYKLFRNSAICKANFVHQENSTSIGPS